MAAQECTINQKSGQQVDPTHDMTATHKFPPQDGLSGQVVECDRQRGGQGQGECAHRPYQQFCQEYSTDSQTVLVLPQLHEEESHVKIIMEHL